MHTKDGTKPSRLGPNQAEPSRADDKLGSPKSSRARAEPSLRTARLAARIGYDYSCWSSIFLRNVFIKCIHNVFISKIPTF